MAAEQCGARLTLEEVEIAFIDSHKTLFHEKRRAKTREREKMFENWKKLVIKISKGI